MQTAAVTDQDSVAFEEFGDSVDVDDDVIVVGERRDGVLVPATGRGHVFERDPIGRWRQTLSLRASNGVITPPRRDLFGESVAVDGNSIFVSAAVAAIASRRSPTRS